MKAYIICNSPLGSDFSGEAKYIIATEDKTIFSRWCSSRAFANYDLTTGIATMLKDNGVTEVYSNGEIVWKDGHLTDVADARLLLAEKEYERENSDAL